MKNTISKKMDDGFSYARSIQRKYATNYSLATILLPKEMREATYALYAFFRLPDEIVDTRIVDAKEKLEDYIRDWKKAYETGDSNNPILQVTAETFRKYNIEESYADIFLNAMKMDTEVYRYETYESLKKYMYGSASVVGLMMCKVIGFVKNKDKTEKEIFEYAENLGYAMQMTNFLRDIKEDYLERGRVYIPQEDMRKFNISESDIKGFCESNEINQNFINLMKLEVDRTKEIYKYSYNGIKYLSFSGRIAVYAAFFLYGGILDEISKNGYNVFSKRASVPWHKKIFLLVVSLISLINSSIKI